MKRFVAAAAAAVLTLVAAPLAQASEHNPGDPGHSVELGKIDHPCAGRKLLYHSHNDALYGTYKNDKLTVMAVDGQQVTDQEKVCFRLAPDADADGNDVSTLTVPEDGSLDFLGEPGSTVWAAPQSADWTDSWRPIWSGLGAFDPAHEAGEIPDNFVDDVMHFDLVEMDGPGDVNVFFSSRVGDPERLFSSADEDMRTITYDVGGHGHFTWTFSEPGIYEMTWQGRAELKGGGVERSEPVTQYWLVGDDTTVGHRTVPKTVVRQAMTVAAAGVVSVTGGVVALRLFDPQLTADQVSFEVMSAFATTGLSTGITAGLSTPSQLVLCLLMYAGRIGPFTLVAALARTQGAQRFAPDVLTNASGFAGIDGLFRFRSDGTNERGLAVMRVGSGGGQAVAGAPKSFNAT